MRRTSRILLLTLLVSAIVASWSWWVRPRKVDMATYAPADSMLYVEANKPLEVVTTIAATDAWRAFQNITGTPASAPTSGWLQGIIGWTGIGPIQSVILARAQVAAVVTDLGTTEEGNTLRIKPEGVILLETHTSERRIRAPFEQALKTFAEKTYGHPILRRVTVDDLEFIEWSAPEGSRQMVGTIVGSLIILGNSEHAVQTCVAVSLGRRTSLKGDQELGRMRLQLGAERALTFGYVPPVNSARLLAVGLPLLLGRAPGDSEFQRLITNGAAKIIGSLGWTSKAYQRGIEDRYLITLQPSIAARLEPNFSPADINSQMQHFLPDTVYSATSYRLANPAASWQGLKTAISSQVDTLSTIVFSSLLKSSLLSYGINDPEAFLGELDGELLTLRLDENAQRSILIGRMKDRARLRELVTRQMGFIPRSGQIRQTETFEDSHGEFAASIISDFIVVGSLEEVRRYAATRDTNTELNAEKFKRMTLFLPSSTSANIVTYTDDSNRVRSFIYSVIAATGAPAVAPARVEEVVTALPFSVTETSFDAHGIQRITRSPLGQFSTVLPLVVPERVNSVKTNTESK
jgi:hypothetical protein